METRLVFPLVMLLGILLESNLVLPTPVSKSDYSVLEQASVFETGKFHPITSGVGTASSCSPPRPLLIVRPEEQGTYPVILFHHGTGCQNSWYTDVFKFISSHGYIVVAPQLYNWIPPSGQSEIDSAAKVANWLPSGLQCVLPKNIKGDLHNLALAGHSRGGYIAFALELGLADVPLEVNFSALVGVDPVAGPSKNSQLKPKILHYESCSFNISIPVAIIGTGLGNKSVFPLTPACAPDGVSHTEIFNECKPPCSHFVTRDYGHMDVLDDGIGPLRWLARTLCKGCAWGVSRDPMRKTVGGIFVAFLEAFFKGNYKEYNNILQNRHCFVPATLEPVHNKSEGTSCSGLSAMSMPAFALALKVTSRTGAIFIGNLIMMLLCYASLDPVQNKSSTAYCSSDSMAMLFSLTTTRNTAIFCKTVTVLFRQHLSQSRTKVKGHRAQKMETRLVFPLVMLLGILLESNLVLPTPVSESDHSVLEQASVFETGKFHPDVGIASSCSPPRPLLIVRPEEQGTYPVILFHHGTDCRNSWYTDVLKFISSHGYIVVAPQLYNWIPPSGQSEIDSAAKVANWLPSGLQCVLPKNIKGDLHNLALAGHSRGGYIAFALELGLADVPLEVNFSALVGIDPVAGTSKNDQLEPKILDHESCFFNISIPVAIIGTGLGNKPVFPLAPACAPDGVSHTEIFNKCKPPCSHFVTRDYGHRDVLDDGIGPLRWLARTLCKGCAWGVSRDPMRKTVGGIFVAFLEAFFKGNYKEYNNLLQKHNHFAPATLDPVQNKSEGKSSSALSAMSMPVFSF
ncbi:hypothetical protein SADUNF_Sadunf05G0158200 [Salix dunnii]|uniref:Chlorophyllase n=1 Tax=Salix dunnii TaxID=1413687 RepID=A0A835K290_9ROSI|nr:hypothetical protein SADUNF_Sadunf05G0158200 [Salix dunnii]